MDEPNCYEVKVSCESDSGLLGNLDEAAMIQMRESFTFPIKAKIPAFFDFDSFSTFPH